MIDPLNDEAERIIAAFERRLWWEVRLSQVGYHVGVALGVGVVIGGMAGVVYLVTALAFRYF